MRPDGKLQADCVLVGGGLANTLIALRLVEQRPDLNLIVVERGARIGGNHTWCFHSTDLGARDLAWVDPLIVSRWRSQEVRFARYTRVLSTGYNAVSSERLHATGMARLGDAVWLGAEAVSVTAGEVTLADGRRIGAPCVIDGRGLRRVAGWHLRYQKFVGLEVELTEPCRQARPIIMDATVPQIDGFRFMYTLPFSRTRLLIEDTYYSSDQHLDVALLTQRIERYAAAHGWRVARVVRRESGVLPVVLAGDLPGRWSSAYGEVALSGLRAGLFHPTTGYSLPDAVRVAGKIAALPVLTTERVSATIAGMAGEAWRRRGFFRMLNRLLMQAAEPCQRAGVMQRFYQLPERLIERFYAARLTSADKARILVGRPPISFASALKVVRAPRLSGRETTHDAQRS
jgi:lycopene beta-cyclase